MTMTRRERLRRCYFLEELDRPAVYTRTGYPRGDATYADVRAFMEAHSERKVSWSAGALQSRPVEEIFTEPHSDDFDREVRLLHTPGGTLKSTALVSRKGQPGMIERHFIETAEDVETYLTQPEPDISGEVTSFFEADAAIGEAGIVDVGLGSNPGGCAAVLCGSENLALLSLTDREAVLRLCERCMRTRLRLVDYLVRAGVGPFFSMNGEEYIVPPLHGPKDFADFNTAYDRPIIERIHEAGGRMHIHSHGSIKSVFQGFLDMGADVLHPIEPPPMGDMPAREAKALARGRLCLEGNIQISHMYEHTAEQIRAETEQLIEDAFDDRRGLIVCPTASPYIRGKGAECFPQYRAMVETVLAHG